MARPPRAALALAVAVTLLVALGAVLPEPALRDAATLRPVPGAWLEHPPTYLVLAPFMGVLDLMTVLSLRQHYAWAVSLLLVYGAWRLLRRGRRRGLLKRVGIEAAGLVLFLTGLGLLYLWGIRGPRPVAALRVEDPDVVVVDFHSHTRHSHDGLPHLTAERRRHEQTRNGFHATYITDHLTWKGVEEGRAGNPARSGEGAVLLPGVEARLRRVYTNALGEPTRYRPALRGSRLDPDSLAAEALHWPTPPVLVATLPMPLDSLIALRPDQLHGFAALELVNASPKGLEQSRGRRHRMLHLADSLDLALVSGSNNHGLGQAISTWTLVPLPGWRQLTPDSLDRALRARILSERRRAAVVVERPMAAPPAGTAGLVLTLPRGSWQLFASLPLAQRAVWLLYAWGAVALLAGLRRAGEKRRAGAAAERTRGARSPDAPTG